MSGLAQLQRQLQAHVLNGDKAIETAIGQTATVDTTTRLAVYGDAYRLRLIEALESNYPVLAELLGADQFASIACDYINQYPSQHYSIRWFGHRFAERLATTHIDDIWLSDLAHWEWATANAFDAADAPPLTPADLLPLAPSDWPSLKLTAQPSLVTLQLHSNIAAIVTATANEQSPPQPIASAATHWCIWRQDLTVRYRSLFADEVVVINSIINGTTFGDLCEQLTTHMAAEDVPLRAASLLKQWLDEQWLVQIT